MLNKLRRLFKRNHANSGPTIKFTRYPDETLDEFLDRCDAGSKAFFAQFH